MRGEVAVSEFIAGLNIGNASGSAINQSQAYWASSLHAILLLLAILYIVFAVKEKSIRKIFLGYTIIFFIVYLFPVSASIIMLLIEELVYWRMFWMLPTSIIIAFAFTHIVERLKGQKQKLIITGIIVVLIMVTGTWIYRSNRFVNAANLHKLPEVVPIICGDITNDAAKYGQQPRAVVANSIVPYIRQYDASIELFYGRGALKGEDLDEIIQEILHQTMYDIPDYIRLAELLEYTQCNYFVWQGSEESYNGFLPYGYRIVNQVDDYVVYYIGDVDNDKPS